MPIFPLFLFFGAAASFFLSFSLSFCEKIKNKK